MLRQAETETKTKMEKCQWDLYLEKDVRNKSPADVGCAHFFVTDYRKIQVRLKSREKAKKRNNKQKQEL